MTSTILTEADGHVLRVGLNRPAKRNAFDREMLDGLGEAYGRLDRDPDLWCGLLWAEGEMFTAGLDLPGLAPEMSGRVSRPPLPEGYVDPMGLRGARCRKPVVVAVQGRCYTLGIELILAADVAVAADDTLFAQLEVARGIFPFAGANWRFPQRAGWGNAMRWVLTAEHFDAQEALRIGLVQEVAPAGQQIERAAAIAHRIASMAPLGTQAALANGRLGLVEGEAAAVADTADRQAGIFATADAAEAIAAMTERREPRFVGR